jgi:diadenosine tetraphosphate (Ap4A) HIT family hydrolase
MTFELPDLGDCVFCEIVDGDAEAKWVARPTADSRVACFHNRLKWARVMLLIVPTEHITQHELWSSDVLVDAARLAVEMGDKHCGDEGYRAISNFGLQAHQSQTHGHIHVVSGTSRQINSAVEKSRLSSSDGMTVKEFEVEETPFAARISPTASMSQRELWSSGQILDTSLAALEATESHSPKGYRLLSSFEPAVGAEPAGSNSAGLFLLGGGQLGLYV